MGGDSGEVVVSTLLLMVWKKLNGKDQQKYHHESPSDICLILIISIIFAMWIGLNNPYKHSFNKTASQRAEKTWKENPSRDEHYRYYFCATFLSKVGQVCWIFNRTLWKSIWYRTWFSEGLLISSCFCLPSTFGQSGSTPGLFNYVTILWDQGSVLSLSLLLSFGKVSPTDLDSAASPRILKSYSQAWD